MSQTLPINLQDITVIRENQRFGTYRATDVDGNPVFVKQIRHPKLAESLRKEIYGLERIRQLAEMHDFPFAAPVIKDSGGDFIVTDWAEGRTMEFGPEMDDLGERVNFLANSYAALDRVTETVRPGRAAFSVPSGHKNLAQWLGARIQSTSYTDYFDAALIEKSVQQLEVNLPSLTARFTHADFTPHNVMEDSHGKRTLIDWESANDLWPRFYDIVNFTFNKTVSEPALKNSLQQLFGACFEKIGASPRAHLTQLNTIATLRALSSISELLLDPNEYQNTEETMNDERARFIAQTLENTLGGRLYADN